MLDNLASLDPSLLEFIGGMAQNAHWQISSPKASTILSVSGISSPALSV
ncbi:hypothetical protein [Celeribacter baekdonensis]|nr:hypothetical protein [Celeribacter baekdonensis]